MESNRPTNFEQLTHLVDRIADLQAAAGAMDSERIAVDLGVADTVTFSWIV